MNKRFSVLVLSMAMVLAACTQSESPTVTVSVTPSSAPTDTKLVARGTATQQPGCTVRSRQPTPDATQQSVLPPPGDADWVKGADNAYVTIVEYSDFQ